MERENTLGNVFAQFDRSARQFCSDTQGLFCEIESEYKGTERPENLRRRTAKIYYHSMALRFTYTAHGVMSLVNSILSCAVCFDKNGAGIPLQLAADYCDVDVAVPLSVPLITNPEGMVQAFGCIGAVLEDLLPEFTRISTDADAEGRVLAAYHAEIRSLFEVEDPVPMQEYVDSFFNLRFTSDAFLNAIKGKYAKAVKQLGRVKKLTGYEKRMLRIWSGTPQPEGADLSAVVKNALAYNDQGVAKADLREFGAMFLSWVVLTVPISLCYLAVFFLLVLAEGRDSVYLMGPQYNFPYCIMAGFITAIAVSYFTRLTFIKLLYRKDFQRYCEMDSITNGGGADKFMRGFLWVIVTLCLVSCLFFAKWNLNFMANGFTDNSEFWSLKGEYYPYSQIEKVYYKPDRVNAFDEVLVFPSYVIVLKDGREIDLYEHGEISDYEDELLDHLRKKGVPIEMAKSKA